MTDRRTRSLMLAIAVVALALSCVEVTHSANYADVSVSLPCHKQALVYWGRCCGIPGYGFQVWDVRRTGRDMTCGTLLFHKGFGGPL